MPLQSFPLYLSLLILTILTTNLTFIQAIPPPPVPYPCLPGFALQVDGSCKECLPGTATDNPSWGCDRCPDGTITPYSTVTSTALCQPCPLRYIASPDQSRCIPCPRGHVAIGRGQCLKCRKGSRITDTGRCIKCDYFSISTSQNSRRCTPCPPGLFPDGKHIQCIRRTCPIGYTWFVVRLEDSLSASCRICPPNSIRPKAMPDCMACDPYQVAYPSKKPMRCVKCPPGTFISGLLSTYSMGMFQNRKIASRQCVQCPANTTTLGYSKATCRSLSEPCPVGTFEDVDGDCQTCVRNMRRSIPRGVCIPCPHGYVGPGGTSTKCRKCPPNSVVLNGRCDCAAGYVFKNGRCVPCSPGTYRTPEMNPFLSDNTCLACPSNTFSGSAAASCSPCPPGRSSVTTGGRACLRPVSCPEHYVIPNDEYNMWALARTCVSAVSGCPSGLVNGGRWGTTACFNESSGLFQCAAGWLSTQSPIGPVCSECQFGVAAFRNSTNSWECVPCRLNQVRVGGVFGSCVSCENGFVPDPSGDNQCVCPDGSFVQEGQCLPCDYSKPLAALGRACLFQRLL